MEAFGNAKTIRNNNSSRFGKWIEIHFLHGTIVGAKTINYLLEKTRVVQQALNERNYHIFYQLLAYADLENGNSAAIKKSLSLSEPATYMYLNGSQCTEIAGVDDAEQFVQTLKSLNELKFTELEINTLLKILASILHIGNINFENDASEDKCKIKENSFQHLGKASQLLEIEAKALEKALITRSLQIRNENMTISLSVSKAIESRDSLAKHLYGEMFDWLVDKINLILKGVDSPQVQFVGVLDMYVSFNIEPFNYLDLDLKYLTTIRLNNYVSILPTKKCNKILIRVCSKKRRHCILPKD